jgi:hypothetical protein
MALPHGAHNADGMAEDRLISVTVIIVVEMDKLVRRIMAPELGSEFE